REPGIESRGRSRGHPARFLRLRRYGSNHWRPDTHGDKSAAPPAATIPPPLSSQPPAHVCPLAPSPPAHPPAPGEIPRKMCCAIIPSHRMAAIDLDLRHMPPPPRRSDYTIAAVGCGFIMRDVQLPAYRAAGFPVAAIAGHSPGEARGVAALRGIPRGYG